VYKRQIIDGECSLEDVRDILVSVRAEPAICEEIAIAMLEDRAWQLQLCSGSADLCHPSTATVQLAESCEASMPPAAANVPLFLPFAESKSEPISPSDALSTTTPTVTEYDHRDAIASHWKNWLAMAASLLAVAVLGYSVGQQGSQSGIPRDLVQQSVQNDSANGMLIDHSAPATTLASHKPDYRMELPKHDRFLPGGEVPLYVVKSLDQWQQLDQPLPQEFRFTPEQMAELNLQGIGIEKDFNVLTGRFEDGRTFVVPIRSIRLAPVQ
jgi:hypothetical protein